MSKRSAQHATFVIERIYNTPPARVFAAWSDSKAKARWFVGPDEWENPTTSSISASAGKKA